MGWVYCCLSSSFPVDTNCVAKSGYFASAVLQRQQLSEWIMGGRPRAFGCGLCMRQKFHKNTSSKIHFDRERFFPIWHCHVIILDLTTLVCTEHFTTQQILVKPRSSCWSQGSKKFSNGGDNCRQELTIMISRISICCDKTLAFNQGASVRPLCAECERVCYAVSWDCYTSQRCPAVNQVRGCGGEGWPEEMGFCRIRSSNDGAATM